VSPFEFVTEEAVSPPGEEWKAMTFPSYRHLPALAGTGAADAQGVRPVARCARVDGRPIGFALADLPRPDREYAELCSVFVADDCRNRGVATELIRGLEDDLARRGVPFLNVVYMTGKPSIAALERVLAKRGFTPPTLRTIVMRFTPEEPPRTDWYGKARLPPDCTIFPWKELLPEERDALKRSQAELGWIHPELEPWRFDENFDERSSLGLRRAGEVVGWVINHRIAPDLVRFTVGFVRQDMARLGASFPLWVASVERLRGTGVTCTFVTPSHFKAMNRFVLRRCAPFFSFCGETRGSYKDLGVHPR
jgi:GNAT superfamily N-acetyltransferase